MTTTGFTGQRQDLNDNNRIHSAATGLERQQQDSPGSDSPLQIAIRRLHAKGKYFLIFVLINVAKANTSLFLF